MTSLTIDETFISVDIESAGPNPGCYSLLSIGACSIAHPEKTFYVELKPVNEEHSPTADQMHGLSMETLRQTGLPPEEGLRLFDNWLKDTVPPGEKPVFVAFNAPFDWMFVCDYFYRFLGDNPFGHSAIDIKAFYMGKAGVTWKETSMRHLSPRYMQGQAISHNALEDARDQAHLFRAIFLEGNQDS